MSSLVEIQNLKVYFDIKRGFIEDFLSKTKLQVKAVNGVSFSIEKGEIVSLVGESGSGKTTIGKALLNLVPVTEGDIFFRGEKVKDKKGRDKRLFRQNAQMIFQDPYQSLNPRDLIVDIVAEPLEVNRLVNTAEEKLERVKTALELAGLVPAEEFLYRYPHELSGGQRQRVAMASALILDPKIIVADEPVSMLDVSIRLGILNLMMELRDKKEISYLFITHDLSLAWVISDKIAILYLGRMMEMGDADTIISSCLHPYTQALTSVMPVPRVKKDSRSMVLKGEIPDPLNLPAGCPFNSRCPKAREICAKSDPVLKRVGEKHWVACHLVEGDESL